MHRALPPPLLKIKKCVYRYDLGVTVDDVICFKTSYDFGVTVASALKASSNGFNTAVNFATFASLAMVSKWSVN